MEQTTNSVNWRQWLTHPHLVHPTAVETLDMLAERLAGATWPEDRHAAVEAFIKTAKEEGLVTAQEYIRLRSALASEMYVSPRHRAYSIPFWRPPTGRRRRMRHLRRLASCGLVTF